MTGTVARPLRALVSAFACLAVLVGCASRGYQAPVTDLSPPPPVRAPNATVPPPAAPDATPVPTYVVKPGDTLYSIAQKFGQDYRQIAAWNALDPSYHIQVNQVLRVGPPEPLSSTNVAESSPVGTSSIEQHPLGAPGAPGTSSSVAPPVGPPPPAGPAPLLAPGSPAGPGGAAATNDAPMKTGPLGLKRPYSDATLAELSRPDSGTDASAAALGAASTPQSAPPSGAPPGPPPPGLPPAQPAAPAASDSSGDLPAIGWIWPAKGPLLSEFNDPKNKGIDIAGKMGDPIVASGSGTVIYVGQGLRGLGNLVVVKHTEGLISVYAHNSKILVANNQPVKKGDQIAEMGNSDSEKVELHFEIRRQGAPVDPLKFLPSR